MMLSLYKILLGLLGLGVVVFVHELGHFLAARWMKIGVEAFSIGWGKPFFKKKIGDVEYRLGVFPLGGYCKFKGDSDYTEAYNKIKQGIAAEEGSYFAAHPFRRIVACLGGPLFNLIFAVLVLSVIWGIGFEVNTPDNRIVLVSEFVPESVNPADEAGLMTGDRIIEINGRKIETFNDIRENIAVNPERELPIQVDRNGQILRLSVRPAMEKSTGAGQIGVYFWADPLIERIAEGSPAEIAGLRSGDRITRVNGTELPYTVALIKILEDKPQVLDIEYLREGQVLKANLIPVYGEAGTDLGIAWKILNYRTPRLSPPLALVKGASETWKTFVISVRSLSLLFRGVDLTQAVSGPVRITYMVGDIATEGFSQGFGLGMSYLANFLSLISIALCIMNLLPLPILDGGMILLFLAEGVFRKPPPPRFVSVFQTVGVVLIAGLMIFALFGDILYLVRR
jgi:regulator of sigma E protease